MKTPGEQTGRDTLSILAPLGIRHSDGQPVTREDTTRKVSELAGQVTRRSAALRALEAQGKALDPLQHAEKCREARIDAFRVRVWSGLEGLARESVSL